MMGDYCSLCRHINFMNKIKKYKKLGFGGGSVTSVVAAHQPRHPKRLLRCVIRRRSCVLVDWRSCPFVTHFKVNCVLFTALRAFHREKMMQNAVKICDTMPS